jgi:hypothetical protein
VAHCIGCNEPGTFFILAWSGVCGKHWSGLEQGVFSGGIWFVLCADNRERGGCNQKNATVAKANSFFRTANCFEEGIEFRAVRENVCGLSAKQVKDGLFRLHCF